MVVFCFDQVGPGYLDLIGGAAGGTVECALHGASNESWAPDLASASAQNRLSAGFAPNTSSSLRCGQLVAPDGRTIGKHGS